MPTHYVITRGSDVPSKLPNVEQEQDYFEHLYQVDNPPAEFRRRYEFELPSGITVDQNRRIVVAFMIDPTDGADMRYVIRLNGVEVASGHPRGGTKRGMWEVASGERLLDAPATNVLEVWVLPNLESRGFLKFSDVVIWFTST